jgi:hypothetical protein
VVFFTVIGGDNRWIRYCAVKRDQTNIVSAKEAAELKAITTAAAMLIFSVT